MHVFLRASALCALLPAVAASQASMSANATIASAYVWRGVTFANATVVQPKLSLAHTGRLGTVTAFAAANVEPTGATTPDALRQGGTHSGLNELDLVAQWSRSVRDVSLTAGWMAYRFNGHNDVITSDFNTHEVYAAIKLDHAPLAPSLTAYQDVATIHGLYLEGGLSQSVGLATTLSATAGYSVGQERRGDLDLFYNFEKRGVTHLDLGATTVLHVAGLAVSPMAHLQFSPAGQNTRITGALPRNADHAQRAWVGIDLAWLH